jgi:hypothetical protein
MEETMELREDKQLTELIARMEIDKLLCNYLRGQDRLDPILHRSVFFDDATLDYGFFQGDPDAFVDMAQGALTPHASNHHMMGQAHIDVEIENDVAFGEIYFNAFHRVVDGDQKTDLIIAGRYIDRYEKRFGTWKIAHRSEVVDFARTDPASDDVLETMKGTIMGGRGADDLSFDREALRKR